MAVGRRRKSVPRKAAEASGEDKEMVITTTVKTPAKAKAPHKRKSKSIRVVEQKTEKKVMAVNATRFPEETVNFEDVGFDKKRGKILKTLKTAQNGRQTDPRHGQIVYRTSEGPIEIPFGDRDQIGDYTLQTDDIVEFYIATDWRDRLQRATNITLSEDTFLISNERREKGFVVDVKEGYGLIRCTDRNARIFFHYSEMLDIDHEIKLQLEVEFTVLPDHMFAGRLVATRIKHLPKGSIAVEQYLPYTFSGTVEKVAGMLNGSTPAKGLDPDSPGIILYDTNNTKQTITFTTTAIDGPNPKLGDKVEFQICESRKNNTKNAVSVRTVSGTMLPQSVERLLGFVASIKDSAGTVESVDRENEFNFQFKNVEGDPTELDVGDEVEFVLSSKTSKPTVDNIRKLKYGTIANEELLPGVLEGKVVRCIRPLNSDQQEYCGLIQTIAADKNVDDTAVHSYAYSVRSLIDKQEELQKGEAVRFQIAVATKTGKRYAACVAPVRRFSHSHVDSIKGQAPKEERQKKRDVKEKNDWKQDNGYQQFMAHFSKAMDAAGFQKTELIKSAGEAAWRHMDAEDKEKWKKKGAAKKTHVKDKEKYKESDHHATRCKLRTTPTHAADTAQLTDRHSGRKKKKVPTATLR